MDRATTARLDQHNLPIKQRQNVPRRDGADDEGGAGPGDQERARLGVVIVPGSRWGAGDGSEGCSDCVDCGVVAVQHGIRIDLVEDHDGEFWLGCPDGTSGATLG